MSKKKDKWSLKDTRLLIISILFWLPMIFIVPFKKISTRKRLIIEVTSTLTAFIIFVSALNIFSSFSQNNEANISQPATVKFSVNESKLFDQLKENINKKYRRNSDLNASANKMAKAAISARKINHSKIMQQGRYGFSSYSFYVDYAPSEAAYYEKLEIYRNKSDKWDVSSFQDIGISSIKDPRYDWPVTVIVFAKQIADQTQTTYVQNESNILYGQNESDAKSSSGLPPLESPDLGDYNGYEPYVGEYGDTANPDDSSYRYTSPETSVTTPDNCHAGYYLCN